MQTRWVWTALWLGSVILAWFLGNSMRWSTARAERLPRARETGMEPGKGPPPAGTASVRRDAGGANVPPAPGPIDVESFASGAHFMNEAMGIVGANLRRGAPGHRDLLILISELSRREDEISILLAGDEREAAKLSYRWLRVIVNHEAEVVDFVDGILCAAVETPEWFDPLDAGTLEFLTGTLGHILPGMASDAQLARIRAHIGALLERDAGTLPPALAGQLDSLRAFHDAWAGPLAVDEAHALLNNPNVEPAEKFEVLRRSPPEAAKGIALASILGAALREQGLDDVIGQLGRFELNERDRAALDESMLEWLTIDESARWRIGSYLAATRRREWARQQPFIEDAVRRGGEVRSAMLYGLQSIDGVDKAYVQRLLAISDLTEGERGALERVR